MSQQVLIKALPHPGQAEVHNSPARFRVLGAGRRWGKTRLGVNECLDVASRGGRAWWISPSYKMSEVGWRPIRQLAAKIGAEIRRVDRLIVLANGGEIGVRSADNPDSLRGESLDLVVIDEAAFVKEQAWTEALRPALSDRKGKAIFISTPKGRNWFWQAYQRGLEPDGEWQSWQLPTVSNPFIDPDEVQAARSSLPERIFRQEYLAEFIDDNDAVFRRVLDAANSQPLERAEAGRTYTAGIDWGKLADFTVITVIDDTGRVVYVDRFNQIDYTFQVQRLRVVYDRFKPHNIVAESNSMGEPLIEMLQRDNLPVTPFQTTNASKKAAIEALSLAFERGDIEIPNDPVLIAELQAFEATRLPSGLIRYAAPDGYHDDMVMSLAMAWHGRETTGLILFGA